MVFKSLEESMAYKRDSRAGFIKDALKDGYSVEEINNYLSKKGYEPVSKTENFIYNDKLSKLTGVTGGVAGTAFLGKPGAMLGAMGGKAAGNLAEDIYEITKGAYKVPENYRDAFNQGMSNVGDAAKWGIGAEAIVNIPDFIKALFNPFGTTKNVTAKVREKVIGDKVVPAEQAQIDSLINLRKNDYYRMAPIETQKAADSSLNKFYSEINPFGPKGLNEYGYPQIGTQQNIGINQMYQKLTPFEDSVRAYNQNGQPMSATISEGTNLSSRAIREYLNSQIPKAAQVANNIYSTVSNLQNKLKTPVRIAGGALLYKLINKLLNR